MSKDTYSFNGEVWRWPGDAGWHFVNLPKILSKQIKGIGKRYGAGFVKVDVLVGKSKWTTALFPHKDSEGYLLSIKQNIRKKENIWEGDIIKVSLKLK